MSKLFDKCIICGLVISNALFGYKYVSYSHISDDVKMSTVGSISAVTSIGIISIAIYRWLTTPPKDLKK